MQFEIDPALTRKAKVPHELFLTNLIGNHILWFVAALGILNSFWQPVMLVPVLSAAILGFTMWRARKSLHKDDWFVMCHWQIAARRSRAFAIILSLGSLVVLLGWCGYTFAGMQKVAVMAMVGGIGLLPVMVSVLVLIVMESDAMHHASSGKVAKGIYARFPNENAVRIDQDEDLTSAH